MLRILYWAQGDDLVGPPQTSHDKKEKKKGNGEGEEGDMK